MDFKRVLVYSKLGCRHCKAAKALLAQKGIPYYEIDCDTQPERRKAVMAVTGVTSVPQIFIDDLFVGGNSELQAMEAEGKLVTAVTLGKPKGGSGLSVDTLPEHLWTPEEYAIKVGKGASIVPASAAEVKMDAGNATTAASVPQDLVTSVSSAVPSGGDDAELELIYEAICHPATGVDVGNHRVFLRKRPQTVTGAEVVAWLRSAPAAKLLLTRKTAVSIACDMLDCGMLTSLGLDERFMADGTLYRLQRHIRPSSELFALFPSSSATAIPRMHSNGCCGCCMRRQPARAGGRSSTSSTEYRPMCSEATPSVQTASPTDSSPHAQGFTLPSLCEVGPLNMGSVYHGPTETPLQISEQLRLQISALFEEFLSHDGKTLDYCAMKSSEAFASYVRLASHLQRVNVFKLSPAERTAFFINVYNALVIHAIALYGHPPTSYRRYVFFGWASYRIGPYSYSLNDMEHGVLRCNRKSPGQFMKCFGDKDPRKAASLPAVDPRIHFALVCGAKSCPSLSVFRPADLDDSLTIAARSFLSDPDNFSADPDRKTVTLSMIFKWYGDDFGATPRDIALRLLPYVKTDRTAVIQRVLDMPDHSFVYPTYSWDANDASHSIESKTVELPMAISTSKREVHLRHPLLHP